MEENLIFRKPPHELSEEELDEAIQKLRSMRIASPKKVTKKSKAKKGSKDKEALDVLDSILSSEE